MGIHTYTCTFQINIRVCIHTRINSTLICFPFFFLGVFHFWKPSKKMRFWQKTSGKSMREHVVILITLKHCKTLQQTAACCNTVQHTATHCNALQCYHSDNIQTLRNTAAHCNTLQHTATRCNTLQHTAKHCNTLQHTATHCDTVHTVKDCHTNKSTCDCNTLQHTAAYC